MAIVLNKEEKIISEKIAEIKKLSGSHSPSFSTLVEKIPEISIKYDYCFLSNPYATKLFFKRFKKDFSDDVRLHGSIEYYPPQNRSLASDISNYIDVPAENIFIGNGATEVIQAVLHNFAKKTVLVCVPTFSPYIEFVKEGVRVVLHQLDREKNFQLDVDRLTEDVKDKKPDTVIIINPNNPDGGYVSRSSLVGLLESFSSVENVVVDESFIHFAGDPKKESVTNLVSKFPNLIVIKSLSKDFGIAGIRLGYGVMNSGRVASLLAHGYLWNISGFGHFFLKLLSDKKFLIDYEKARIKYLKDRDMFFRLLSQIKQIKTIKSSANFFLVELIDGTKASDFMIRLLRIGGIYVRPCGDKVGLSGEYIRIACRTSSENKRVVNAIKKAFA